MWVAPHSGMVSLVRERERGGGGAVLQPTQLNIISNQQSNISLSIANFGSIYLSLSTVRCAGTEMSACLVVATCFPLAVGRHKLSHWSPTHFNSIYTYLYGLVYHHFYQGFTTWLSIFHHIHCLAAATWFPLVRGLCKAQIYS